ncbi:Hypothetical predicted protein [Pelobates cultripes]|uniref:Uncharacterized protein n=1 Tax=Pelobates cultripes TaxID=61616 RepID=A0AAD1SDS6_PELCU|nr:Hypothetical predicted protein [Pelobates cultripes]
MGDHIPTTNYKTHINSADATGWPEPSQTCSQTPPQAEDTRPPSRRGHTNPGVDPDLPTDRSNSRTPGHLSINLYTLRSAKDKTSPLRPITEPRRDHNAITLHQQTPPRTILPPPPTPTLPTDCWGALHPSTRDYTFYSTTHSIYTRLDYFLIPHQNLTLLTTAEILPMTWLDHCPIRIRLKSPLFRPRQMSWRLNKSILSDVTVVDKISHSIQEYFEENETDDVTPLTCWEAHKAVIRGQIIAMCATRKKMAVQEVLDLSQEIALLEARHKRTLDPTLLPAL